MIRPLRQALPRRLGKGTCPSPCAPYLEAGVDDSAGMLERIALHALWHPEFRAAWQSAVRQAADQSVGELLAAEVTGQADAMALYTADVPVPDGWERNAVFAAFMAAVDGEVRRALDGWERTEGSWDEEGHAGGP
jgi:hypothetical protein